MKKAVVLFIILTSLLSQACHKDAPGNNSSTTKTVRTVEKKHRILYINSYNPDYPWSSQIMDGIFSSYNLPWTEEGEVTSEESPVILKVHHMKTLVDHSPEHLKTAVEKARSVISSWKPDVVIASDDNASKYLVSPYYRNKDLPFVFCGINWDAETYGFPTENITGMVEVSLTEEVIERLLPYARGNRIAFLRADDTTTDKQIAYLTEIIPYPFEACVVQNYGEWKKEFILLQDESDILLTTYPSAMPDWDGDEKELTDFMIENTRIPTGGWDIPMTDKILLSIVNSGKEHGEWAARTALEIARGKSPSQIPVTKNIRGAYFLNMALAKKLNILFPVELIETSHLINPLEIPQKEPHDH